MQSTIRLLLQAYDPRVLDRAAGEICQLATANQVTSAGPFPLPAKTEKATGQVLHRRSLDLLNPNHPLLDALLQFNLPAGVHIEIKLPTPRPAPSVSSKTL